MDTKKLIYLNPTELKENKKEFKNFKKEEQKIITNFVNKQKFMPPIIINSKKEVILGYEYLKAATSLGLDKIPTIEVDNLSEDELKKFEITLNKISTFGEFNIDGLMIDIKELFLDENIDITPIDLGFTSIEIDSLLFNQSSNKADETIVKTDEVENLINNVPQIVKLGDLIQLGKHKLYCGDSLKIESYKKLLGQEVADIIISDPPYNVKIQDYVTKQKHHAEFAQASGEMSQDEFIEFLKTITNNLKNASKTGSLHYLFMDWKHLLELQTATKDIYEKLLNICVWDKGKGGMGSFYRSQHEFCLVYQNGKSSHKNNIQLGKNGRNRTNVWNYPGMNSGTNQAKTLSNLHPTVKPTAMLVDILLDASDFNDIVLDAFGGSGSTLIAAQQCRRKARLIEISPHYCDVIIQRWEQLTGKKHKILERAGQ